MIPRDLARLVLTATALSAAPAAQFSQHMLYATPVTGESGVAGLGDVDGDRHADVAIGNYRQSASRRGVIALSGATGKPIWNTSHGTKRVGDVLAAVGDLTGDGIPEVIAGFRNSPSLAGEAHIHDGKTGRVLRVLTGAAGDQLGSFVGPFVDVDRDGTRDIAVGSIGYPNQKKWGRLSIYSGKTFGLLRNYFGGARPEEFGSRAVPLDDLDGDGFDDFAVAAHGVTINAEAGYVRIVSTRFSAVLHQLNGTNRRWVQNLDSIEDQDGDGRRDIVVAWGNNFSALKLIEIYSTNTGKPIRSTLAHSATAIRSIPDQNADRVEDLALSDRSGRASAIRVVSGATLAEIVRVPVGDRWPIRSIDAAGDVNGDGQLDLIAGGSTGGTGAAVFSLRKLRLACDRHELSVSQGGRASYALDAGAAHAGKQYLLAGSVSGRRPGFAMLGQHIPLNIDRYLTLTATNPNLPILVNSFGRLDSAGRATSQFSVLPDSRLIGITFDHAYVVFAPGFTTLDLASNARPVTAIR